MAANWYSTHIYPIIVNDVGRITGLFPFSVAEILLYAFVIWLIVSLIIAIPQKSTGKWLRKIVLMTIILFLIYLSNCGINYHRIPFAESADFQIESYSVQELKEVCIWLTEEVNLLSISIERCERELAWVDEMYESVI